MNRGMNIGTIIGVIGVFVMLIVTVLLTGNRLIWFVDIPSIALVLIGSFFSLMIAFSMKDSIGVFSAINLTFKQPMFDSQGLIQKMVSFSEKARREGLLALEDELEDLDDEFMKKGLRLVVDGTDATIIRDLLEVEITQMQTRHSTKILLVNNWAALAPSFGMAGTVMGLVGMLQNLEDTASIGPNMAMALITTLYGALVSGGFLLPWANKLTVFDNEDANMKEMIIEGVLSIQSGDNTRILAMKLLAYLNPLERIALEAEVLKD
jgi:chemotaxis protein MotA